MFYGSALRRWFWPTGFTAIQLHDRSGLLGYGSGKLEQQRERRAGRTLQMRQHQQLDCVLYTLRLSASAYPWLGLRKQRRYCGSSEQSLGYYSMIRHRDYGNFGPLSKTARIRMIQKESVQDFKG